MGPRTQIFNEKIANRSFAKENGPTAEFARLIYELLLFIESLKIASEYHKGWYQV